MRSDSVLLNDKEKRVLGAFPTEGGWKNISDLARDAFPGKGVTPKTKGNSWTRNSLRKLLRLKLVEHKGAKSGDYKRTNLDPDDLAKKHLKNESEAKTDKPKTKAKRSKAKPQEPEKSAEAS